MDENTIQQTNQKSPIPPVTPTPPQPLVASVKSKNWILITLVLLVIFLSLGAAGFFAYQYVQLKRQVSQTKPTPTILPSPTPDVTADWKTYTNSQYGYTVKYPSNISFKQDRFYFTGDDNRKDTADGFGPNLSILYRGNDVDPRQAAQKELSSAVLREVTINNAVGVQVTNPSLLKFDYYLKPTSGNTVMRIYYAPQEYSPTVSKDKIQEMDIIAPKILSTFRFINTVTPSPTQQPISSKALNYSVPSGWITVQDSTESFTVSYDPTTSKIDTNSTSGLFLLRQRPDPSLGYYGCESVNLYPYDGGSRHQFIYKYLGETPTNESLRSDYKETEYLYNGKSCLLLNGISISQFNSVWGMCDAGNGKAFLFTSCDRDNTNFEKILQTIRVLKI